MLIINIGMPRSGTLWRYKLIRDLVIAGGGKDGLEIRNNYFLKPFIALPNADLNTLKFKRLFPASVPSFLGETYVLNTHAGPSNLAKKLIKQGRLKAIYGFRDPRDCILSMLEYSRRALPQYSNEFLSLKTLQDAINYMQQYIGIWNEWTKLEGIIAVKYEEMLENYHLSVETISNYLNLDLRHEDLDKILKTYLPQTKPEKGVKIHFQHGQANRFRELFNPEELEQINSTYRNILLRMGYDV